MSSSSTADPPPTSTQDESTPVATSSSSSFKERRFKLSRACDRCRRRRIRCDEGHPCQACITANSACTFEEPGKRTHPHKSKRTATLEDRMHQLETIIQAIPPAVFSAVGVSVNALGQPMKDMGSSNGSSDPAHVYPSGVPPPSLHTYPLTNPSTHFSLNTNSGVRQQSPNAIFNSLFAPQNAMTTQSVDQLSEDTSRMSISASYLYFDDEGYTRWQGETSGLPLLDLLVERQPHHREESPENIESMWSSSSPSHASGEHDWFPNRTPKRTDINAEMLWRLITAQIVPELMDSLVQCYLSTSYYILPFLHIPTFLADYGNPQKWGEPGFAAFIVSICCLASRHINDPRVRADPRDSNSAGTQWFELLNRLRTLPIADRPTLYTIQADLIAGVYAVGLGKLSKAAALLSEAVTTSVDAGLHRSADTYDLFDPIEDEVRKRTFWCVYMWDKQLCAHFGRPPMIRVRDCDVGEPATVDDEYITKDGINPPPLGTKSRMAAFACSIRMMVVLESVLDTPTPRQFDASPFLSKASSTLFSTRRYKDLREAEALLDEVHQSIPAHWAHTPETLASDDTIRVTQAERLHCAEQFIRLLIYRHRFTHYFMERTSASGSLNDMQVPQGEAEVEAMKLACDCALKIVSAHLQIATKGLMTYYGVHVIHQLTQAGRTLVSILLNSKSDALQKQLVNPTLEALRSCVGLLRRFSGRYICGMRSGDLMEEVCRLANITLEPSSTKEDGESAVSNTRPPWIRPVRKKTTSATAKSVKEASGSPDRFLPSEFFQNVSTPQPPFSTSPMLSSLSGFSASGQSPSNSSMPHAPLAPQMFSHSSPSFNTLTSEVFGAGMFRGDPGLYVPDEEMMALFSQGNVDMSSLLPSETMQQQSPVNGTDRVSGVYDDSLASPKFTTSPGVSNTV